MKNFFLTLAVFRMVAAIDVMAVVTPIANASQPVQIRADKTEVQDFDFLVGEWRVRHRRLKPDSHEWMEFDGTCSNRKLTNGWANLEEHILNRPDGKYRAIALRSYDPKSRQWSIWWLDSRYPFGPLDPPMRGRFDQGVGTFYSDETHNRKPARVRFIWSQITSTSARWEQAFSSDAGKTWETNWIMNWQRVSSKPQNAKRVTGQVIGPSGFNFLVGEWKVQHRYLRSKPDGVEWAENNGTCNHLEFTDAWANVDEYAINARSGAYPAVALRSFDPKTGEWAIWWLDGRSPAGNLDPPVKGRFQNGVGTFYGETTFNGKLVRVRFIWSQITSSSAHWEQAYSADEGKTWDTNWIMDFRRSS